MVVVVVVVVEKIIEKESEEPWSEQSGEGVNIHSKQSPLLKSLQKI